MEKMEQKMKSKLEFLKKFISPVQIKSIKELALNSEESQYFKDKIDEIYTTVDTMPKTYEADGQEDKAVAYLHYFMNNSDFFIIEKDKEEEQLQAFGLVSLNGHYPELGYISIQELLEVGFELDLEWSPKTLKEVFKELERE